MAKTLSKKRRFGTISIKKIPIPLAGIIMILGLILGIVLVNMSQRLGASGLADVSPQEVRITNVNFSSFVVSWTTKEEASGSVAYGKTSALGNIQRDARNKNNEEGKFFTHFVQINNLEPSTKYYFNLLSEGKSFGNQGKPFEITTASLKTPVDSDLSQGRVLASENQPAEGVIVYISLPNTITQAAITDSSGHWLIPLALARTTDLNDYSNYDREVQAEEIFIRGAKVTASATITTKNDNPVPDIYLGQTYDFLNQMPEITPTLPPQTNTFDESLGSGFQNVVENTELKIISPGENEKINTFSPEFLGTGPRGKTITIKIESLQVVDSSTKINQAGEWDWTPPEQLSPGNHKITVSYTDEEGFLKSVSRSFVVLAAGESGLPSFTATSSGTKTTPSPSISPTTTISPSTTPSPTIKPSPSPTKPASLTSPVPTLTEEESARTTIPSGTPPPSGSILPTKIFLGVGAMALIVGAIFILF